MKNVHLVIPDLFLPKDIVAEACCGLHLPALEKMLGRVTSTGSARADLRGLTLESLLCESFGLPCRPDVPIAPISAAYDGLDEGCWMRADPVHLHLQRDQVLMADVQVGSDEAVALCTSLNEHFAGQGMEFFAPHPQRWYVRLNELPQMRTTPVSQVIGGDVRRVLPAGEDASKWHQVFNEIQMLLFAHPLYEAREARGELPINSVWFWGGGHSASVAPQANFDKVYSDDELTEAFALAAGVPFSSLQSEWRDEQVYESQLLVFTGLSTALQHGDLEAWRDALQDFENNHAQPVWRALCSGEIEQLQVDISGADNMLRVRLFRRDTWAFWRRKKPLARYSMV